jgi:hypothetical protein
MLSFPARFRFAAALALVFALSSPVHASERRIQDAASAGETQASGEMLGMSCSNATNAGGQRRSPEFATRAAEVVLNLIDVAPADNTTLDPTPLNVSPAQGCEFIRLPASVLLVAALALLISAFQMQRASARWRISVRR